MLLKEVLLRFYVDYERIPLLDNFKVIHEISIAWNLDYDRPSFSAKSVARIKKKEKKIRAKVNKQRK